MGIDAIEAPLEPFKMRILHNSMLAI
jgi:hypothetical protein